MHADVDQQASPYLQMLRNRAFTLLLAGGTISTFGDAFFNLTVLWIVYSQTGSTLQTAIVQVVWQLSDGLFGAFAGVLVDRWDRRRVLVATNFLSAAVVSSLAALMVGRGEVPIPVIFLTIFLLNLLSTFVAPASAALMPALVGRELLTAAGGAVATARQFAYLTGSAIAGVLVASAGAVWAVVINAVSFLISALVVLQIPLPKYSRSVVPENHGWWRSILGETRDGWRVVASSPTIRAIVWLGTFVNGASFIGPLYPALVQERLNGGPAVYGMLEAAGIAGGILGGALTGKLERRWGAGRLMTVGWGVVGVSILGVSASPWVQLTFALEVIAGFAMVASNVTLFALTQSMTPDDYLGRVIGLTRSLAVLIIPFSALLGGWLADVLGVIPIYAFGGIWLLVGAALSGATHLQSARI